MTSCNDGNACTIDQMTGSAADCNLFCTHTAISSCTSGDGCCPSGCNASNDTDCSSGCGNGTVESGETCDPPSSCATSCTDGNTCTIDQMTGSAANCNVACVHTAVSSCTSEDGCCPTGCNANNDTDCSSSCGNGTVESGETCDPPSSCPTTCDDGNACTVDQSTGSSANCNLACTHSVISSCTSGDGCCPTGCNANNDTDCSSSCGNGTVEPGETCDPASSCPTSCSDGNACTIDQITGSAANCNVVCAHTGISSCTSGDGCCPTGCNSGNDSDCTPKCGNGVVESGETCDPPSSCPTSCNDGNPCTQDQMTGSGATCNAVCSHSAQLDGSTCDDGNCCTQSDHCQSGACTGTRVAGCIGTAALNLTADPAGRVIDVCFESTFSLSVPWDRFRFDIDVVQPLAEDPGGFLGDLNHDGVLDLLLADYDGRVLMFPGISGQPRLFGNGRYVRRSTPTIADDPLEYSENSAMWVTGDMADLDGDGQLEVVMADWVYRNIGTAAEPELDAQYHFTGGAIWDPTPSLGDLNGDGRPDVVIATTSMNGGISIYWNYSAPGVFSFTQQKILPGGVGNSTAPAVALADLNGDGKLDLAAAETGIYLNTGTTQTPSFDFSNPTPWNVVGGPDTFGALANSRTFLRDVNGDGLPDAYVSGVASTVWRSLLFLNTGSATAHQFTYQGPVIVRSTPADVIWRGDTSSGHYANNRAYVTAGDIDGNGLVDLHVPGYWGVYDSGAILWQFPDESGPSDTTFGYPDLYTFPEHPNINLYCGPPGPHDWLCKPPEGLGAWVDLNGDGLADAMQVGYQAQGAPLTMRARTGTMPFSLSTQSPLNTAGGTQAVGWGVTLVDVDRDGIQDIVAGSGDGHLVYYRNIGSSGAISLATGVQLADTSGIPINVGGSSSWPAALDLDGDGDVDFLVGKQDGTIHRVLCVTPGVVNGYTDAGPLRTDGQDPFNVLHTAGGGDLAPALTAFDVDRDGRQDVVMGDSDGRVWILRNIGTATAPTFRLEPLPLSRTNAAYLEIIDPHNVRAYFALPVLPGQTTLGVHGVPKPSGGTVSGRMAIAQ